jgi:hypothetical protein
MSSYFPHVVLRFVREGAAYSVGQTRWDRRQQRSKNNLNNRAGHGQTLQNSASRVVSDWQQQLSQRKQANQPDLPKAVPFILQIDPNSFQPEQLRSFGIEVIAELEDGFILGASADLQLTDLQKKIAQFIKNERGGGKIPEIWEIIDGSHKPEYILSPELQQQWQQIEDDQIYTVDVGIACIGIKSDVAKSPERKNYQSDQNFEKAVHRWLNDRQQTYQEWDDLKSEREDAMGKFVQDYGGEITKIIDGEVFAKLPDSFTCRISITGKGLKDLVLNFPYVFDVAGPDDIHETLAPQPSQQTEQCTVRLQPPKPDAPKVCIIDSGIQEEHPLLKAAVETASSRSWVPSETGITADLVRNGGHGTRVAGAVLYPGTIPQTGDYEAICWLQNARVLDRDCKLSRSLFPPALLVDIVQIYHGQFRTRIFNHSIAGSTPCRTLYMSAWAAEIDQLTWGYDILFIVAAGNLPFQGRIGVSRLPINEHLTRGRQYPDYLLEDSCRIPSPAQSMQAITVGSISISPNTFDPDRWSLAQQDYPSAFSCTGFGLWDVIKPEVVEYGGDVVVDSDTTPNFTYPPQVCPELVRSTSEPGPLVAQDCIGTSFSAPKVTHIAACLAAELPQESCLLYRALIVQSARWPAWVDTNNLTQDHVIRMIGYGIPSLERALGGANNRITLITRGEQRIKARKAQIFQVKLPEALRSPGEEQDIHVEITLSYKAQPRRTRRSRRKYLSTWLDWECSKKGEDPESFLNRVLKEYDAPETAEEGESIFAWVLGKQKNHGKVHNTSRNAGTIQKDWAVVKSYDLRESFCIAVVGHEGWNNDPNADVPYALVISFETLKTNIPIYTEIASVQVPVEVEVEVTV